MILHEILSLAATKNRAKIALITDKSQMTYGDLEAMAGALERVLFSAGIRPGMSVAMCVVRAEVATALLWVFSRMSLRLTFASVEAILAAGENPDAWIVGAPRWDIPADKQLVLDPKWFDGMDGQVLPPADPAVAGKGWMVFQTSGSTGVPKLVGSPEGLRLAEILRDSDHTPEDFQRHRFMSTLSPLTSWASNRHIAVLAAGGSFVSYPTADKLPSVIDLWQVGLLDIAVETARRLITVPGVSAVLGSLVRVRLGGALAPKELLERVSAICDARITIGYGATETGRLFRDTYDRTGAQPDGWLGLPIRPDLDYMLLDGDGEAAPGLEEGELAVRPKSGGAYSRQSGSMAADGMIRTGDIVRRHGQGYVFTGRAKLLVNTGGNKFGLERIEAELAKAFPGVPLAVLAESGALGAEHIVVATEGHLPDAEALTRLLGASFPTLRCDRVVMVATLPLTPTGKPDRPAIARLSGIK